MSIPEGFQMTDYPYIVVDLNPIQAALGLSLVITFYCSKQPEPPYIEFTANTQEARALFQALAESYDIYEKHFSSYLFLIRRHLPLPAGFHLSEVTLIPFAPVLPDENP